MLDSMPGAFASGVGGHLRTMSRFVSVRIPSRGKAELSGHSWDMDIPGFDRTILLELWLLSARTVWTLFVLPRSQHEVWSHCPESGNQSLAEHISGG